MTILTRIGDNCKIIFVGDSMQADIGKQSGFTAIMEKFMDEESE
jgi:predicted ribonuclease YlaK